MKVINTCGRWFAASSLVLGALCWTGCKQNEYRRVRVYEGPDRSRDRYEEPRTTEREESSEWEMTSPGKMVVE